jgi:putrescine aminotransferase
MLARLSAIQQKYPEWIKEVRGRGLLIGIEMAVPDLALLVTAFMSARGVVVAYTLNNPNVLRMEPPLVIPPYLVERILVAFEESVAEAVETVRSLT